MSSIHQRDRATDGQRFSEFRIGLDHVRFGCANRTELEAWPKTPAELGIEPVASQTRTTRQA